MEGLNRGLPRLGIGKANGSNLTEHIKKLQLKEEERREGDGEKEENGTRRDMKQLQEIVGKARGEEGQVECSCGNTRHCLSPKIEKESLEF